MTGRRLIGFSMLGLGVRASCGPAIGISAASLMWWVAMTWRFGQSSTRTGARLIQSTMSCATWRSKRFVAAGRARGNCRSPVAGLDDPMGVRITNPTFQTHSSSP